jgi:hypothetical protein
MLLFFFFENVGFNIEGKCSYSFSPQFAPSTITGQKTCYELPCPLPDRHLLLSSLFVKRSLHVHIPSLFSIMRQEENGRLLQSDSSKHCPLVAVIDQSGCKDLTLLTMEFIVFRAVTPCSLVLSALSVFRMQLVDSKYGDSSSSETLISSYQISRSRTLEDLQANLKCEGKTGLTFSCRLKTNNPEVPRHSDQQSHRCASPPH